MAADIDRHTLNYILDTIQSHATQIFVADIMMLLHLQLSP